MRRAALTRAAKRRGRARAGHAKIRPIGAGPAMAPEHSGQGTRRQAMTLLVTGGAGFIGGNFVLDWLARSDETIVNLDKLTYAGSLRTLEPLRADPRHVFVRGDIGDARLVAALLAEHAPRAVLNFAAESHVDRAIRDPEPFVATNIVGTFRLLECARAYHAALDGPRRDAFRFVHVSTDEVYGELAQGGPPFGEASRYAPRNPYAASKAAADHLARAWHHTYGLPAIVTNCSNNYGPRHYPEKLIPLVIARALAGRPLPLYGDGRQVRDWLYVGDHCAAIRQVLEAGRAGETYNIGGNCERTNLEVVRALCGLLDELRPRPDGRAHAALIEFVADRPGHDRRYAIDAGKLARELGWRARETFESGLRRTVQWYLDHPDWLDDASPPGAAREGGAPWP